MADLSSLITPLSFDEIRSSIYAVLAATGVTTTTWKPGAVVRTIISGVAIVLAGLSIFIAALAASAFLPLATAEWLRLVALYVYGVVRIEATFATGTVRLTNSSGGIYTKNPGELVLRNPTTQKTYVNTALFTLNGLSFVDIVVAAVEVGSASTSFSGEISELVTTLTGVTSSNAAAIVGFDVEADPALRTRCVEKLGSLSPNGPSDAYGFVARSALRADGSGIGITRVRAKPDGNGGVDVYLATGSGGITGTVGNLTTDLGAVDDQMQRLATPLCVVLNTHSATSLIIPVSYAIWLYNTSGLTTATIATAVQDELTAYFAGIPIGGTVIDAAPNSIYRSEISAVIGRARYQGAPLPIVRVDLALPAADVLPGTGDVPVLGTVTSSVTQISTAGL